LRFTLTEGGFLPVMKAAILFTFVLFSATLAARADFSYTSTSKTTGGMLASVGGGSNNPPSKHYFKGQKMKTETGDTSTIIDFDAQTLTTINNRLKTATVRSLSDIGAAAGQNGASVQVDVKETGQQKTINGYNAKELIMTMDVDNPQAPQMGKMRMEMDLWLSTDVPGIGELRGFYKKNMDRFPWAALSGGAVNQGMQSGIAQMQRKMAEMGGVQVESVMKMKSAGGAAAPAMPQMTAAQQARMAAAMAKLQQQGGPQATAAAQAMARMSGAAPGASNSMMEITTDASDFSTASIPDSVFAIPAGYQKVDPK
jgi:hypothetical protein